MGTPLEKGGKYGAPFEKGGRYGGPFEKGGRYGAPFRKGGNFGFAFTERQVISKSSPFFKGGLRGIFVHLKLRL